MHVGDINGINYRRQLVYIWIYRPKFTNGCPRKKQLPRQKKNNYLTIYLTHLTRGANLVNNKSLAYRASPHKAMLGLRWSCIDHKWFCAKKLIRAIGALKYLCYNNSRTFAEYFIVFEKKTDISLQICSILIWTSYNWKKRAHIFNDWATVVVLWK